ncbi:spore coat protein [Paenibacillus sp. MWE-103]|uniref:Spore coat protein n=1 Tax=Paenibacillus artemisiicola TaxID=1172618 RepID=A0ABS3W8Q5_9BACL|nr:spore coat protein [Paenibacillus artemisiicola]MBO7744695.1 spore coat protein [Paenibacillus artemisiicola]
MYQQQGQAHPMLSDEDLAYTVLADLKRVCGEYATATTESNCPQVRQLFTNLLNSTLQMQGHLYQIMEQNNMYSVASPALRQEVDKQLKQNQQTAQQTQQFLQQHGYGQNGMGFQQHMHQPQNMQQQQGQPYM